MNLCIVICIQSCDSLRFQHISMFVVEFFCASQVLLLAKLGEFTVTSEYRYNRTSTLRWIISHLARYKFHLFGFMFFCIAIMHSMTIQPLQATLSTLYSKDRSRLRHY